MDEDHFERRGRHEKGKESSIPRKAIVLNPEYRARTAEDFKRLEDKVNLLQEHLVLERKMEVTVYAERNYTVLEASEWTGTVFTSEGRRGTKCNTRVRPYVFDGQMRIGLVLGNELYDLRNTKRIYQEPVGNPCG